MNRYTLQTTYAMLMEGVMNRYTLQTTYAMLMEGDEQVHIANYIRHANGG